MNHANRLRSFVEDREARARPGDPGLQWLTGRAGEIRCVVALVASRLGTSSACPARRRRPSSPVTSETSTMAAGHASRRRDAALLPGSPANAPPVCRAPGVPPFVPENPRNPCGRPVRWGRVQVQVRLSRARIRATGRPIGFQLATKRGDRCFVTRIFSVRRPLLCGGRHAERAWARSSQRRPGIHRQAGMTRTAALPTSPGLPEGGGVIVVVSPDDGWTAGESRRRG